MDKIVFLDAETIGDDISLEKIGSLGELTVYNHTSPEEYFERAKDCEILITNKVVIRKEQIDAAPKLRLICEASTGVDNIDVQYAREKGIEVRNVKGYSTDSVAQTTFMLMLSLIGHSAHFDSYIKSGAYSASGCYTEVKTAFCELAGKNLGIVGLGAIGSKVAQIAAAFGMNVAYFPTSGVPHSDLYPALELEKLLAQSDIVSVHAPRNSRTDGLIGYEQLRQMKRSAIILNLGRGGIVVEKDLARALDEGLLQGAGLDVYSAEPLPADHPYLKMQHLERLLLTPHIGWAGVEARQRLVDMVVQNIRTFQGE